MHALAMSPLHGLLVLTRYSSAVRDTRWLESETASLVYTGVFYRLAPRSAPLQGGCTRLATVTSWDGYPGHVISWPRYFLAQKTPARTRNCYRPLVGLQSAGCHHSASHTTPAPHLSSPSTTADCQLKPTTHLETLYL